MHHRVNEFMTEFFLEAFKEPLLSFEKLRFISSFCCKEKTPT